MPNAASAQGGSSNRSVMVVDDERELTGYLAEIFKDHHWRVMTAFDGSEALEKLSSGSVPDLLVLDLAMPRMDGLELARKVRSRHPGMRIIISTAYNVRFEVGQMRELNIRWVLTKPYGWDELIAAAEAALG